MCEAQTQIGWLAHAHMCHMLEARRIAKPEAAFKIARLRPQLPRPKLGLQTGTAIA